MALGRESTMGSADCHVSLGPYFTLATQSLEVEAASHGGQLSLDFIVIEKLTQHLPTCHCSQSPLRACQHLGPLVTQPALVSNAPIRPFLCNHSPSSKPFSPGCQLRSGLALWPIVAVGSAHLAPWFQDIHLPGIGSSPSPACVCGFR